MKLSDGKGVKSTHAVKSVKSGSYHPNPQGEGPTSQKSTAQCCRAAGNFHRRPLTLRDLGKLMPKIIDLTGQVFGRLTAIERLQVGASVYRWKCLCECGKVAMVPIASLNRGSTKSCVCLRQEVTRSRATSHGMTSTPEYQIWSKMLDRCNNPNSQAYGNYQERSPDGRWLKFENFISDMGLRPSERHTLERRDNDEPYGPDNCVWDTRHAQSRNTSRNVIATVDGHEMCLHDACQLIGINLSTLRSRISKGASCLEASGGRISNIKGAKNGSQIYSSY